MFYASAKCDIDDTIVNVMRGLEKTIMISLWLGLISLFVLWYIYFKKKKKTIRCIKRK